MKHRGWWHCLICGIRHRSRIPAIAWRRHYITTHYNRKG